MVWDCDCEAVVLIDCEAVRDTLCDAVSVDEGVRVPLRVADWLRVCVGLVDWESVRAPLCVCVWEREGVCEGVRVTEGDCVALGVDVGVFEGEQIVLMPLSHAPR